MKDAFGPLDNGRLLHPVTPIVVSPQKTMATDMLELGDLGESSLKLLLVKVKGIVVNGFLQGFKCP